MGNSTLGTTPHPQDGNNFCTNTPIGETPQLGTTPHPQDGKLNFSTNTPSIRWETHSTTPHIYIYYMCMCLRDLIAFYILHIWFLFSPICFLDELFLYTHAHTHTLFSEIFYKSECFHWYMICIFFDACMHTHTHTHTPMHTHTILQRCMKQWLKEWWGEERL